MDSVAPYDPIGIGPLHVAVGGQPGPPRIAVGAEGLPASVAYLVNGVADGQYAGLPDALRKGEDFAVHGASVERPYPDDPAYEAELRDAWRAWTGEGAGDDVVVARTAVSDGVLLPRALLLGLVEALVARRRAWSPAEAADPWAELEQRALAIDGVASTPATSDTLRALLRDLERLELLRPSSPARDGLDPGRHAVLWSYARAADALRAYQTSSDRAAYLPVDPSADVLGWAVSLEWFRTTVPTPDTGTPHAWTAFYEKTFRGSAIDPAGAWRVYERIAGAWYELRFRWEVAERPSLVWAAPVDGPAVGPAR